MDEPLPLTPQEFDALPFAAGEGDTFADPPWWVLDPPEGTVEEEHAAWLASLPADIRAAYESGPWDGSGETLAAGFYHHDDDGLWGLGFASGGQHDQLPPGPQLADAAARAGKDGRELGESELIGVLCAWQRLTSWAQAGQAACLNTLVQRRKDQSVQLNRPALAGHVDDEAAAALSLTGRAAGRLLEIAVALGRLPAVQQALEAARIDWAKACLFADLLAGLPDEVASAIAAKVLADADCKTSGQLRAALIRAVLAYDPDSVQRRRRAAAREDARVELWDEPSGNRALVGRELAPADAVSAAARLTAAARWLRRNGLDGTIDQLRVAAYIALLSGRPLADLVPAAPTAPSRQTAAGDRTEDSAGPDAADNATCRDTPAGDELPAGYTSGRLQPPLTGTINLTMPISAWSGRTAAPGELAGHGPADAATCRDLAARTGGTARWCLTLTTDDGQVIAHACAAAPPPPGAAAISWARGLRDKLVFLQSGRCDHPRRSSRYRPPRNLVHLIRVRQRTCSFPGCRRPARRTDLDHTLAYHAGGVTCECNLAPLCRRHHQAKQVPGWQLEQPEPGVMVWHLPHGRAYQTAGEPYPV